VAIASVVSVHAQDTTKPTSVDVDLLNIENSKIPKEYIIAGVNVTGIHHLDTAIVLSISGLQVGDKLTIPGSDLFAKSIQNLWRQKLFSNVQVYITRVEGERIWIELSVAERPRLGNFKFVGIKKTEAEELQGKVGLVKQVIITENMRRNIVEVTEKYYRDKGFQNIKVTINEKPDPAYANSNFITIYVDKGGKVKIDEINIFGNENVEELKIKKQMKGTKEMMREEQKLNARNMVDINALTVSDYLIGHSDRIRAKRHMDEVWKQEEGFYVCPYCGNAEHEKSPYCRKCGKGLGNG
jgi:outer membrane protein insertion porin family